MIELHKRELIAEYVKLREREREIMGELTLEEACEAFFALASAGIYP